uniref:Interleukin-6 n=1 Tax=Branchiostoma floridae TaxID=7739 RepID=C3ZSR8_BRAFL|eukprot:XP_002588459.1 hypothetical protein BRAFLDRAFT_63408 [Branchiostoma floridae]
MAKCTFHCQEDTSELVAFCLLLLLTMAAVGDSSPIPPTTTRSATTERRTACEQLDENVRIVHRLFLTTEKFFKHFNELRFGNPEYSNRDLTLRGLPELSTSYTDWESLTPPGENKCQRLESDAPPLELRFGQGSNVTFRFRLSGTNDLRNARSVAGARGASPTATQSDVRLTTMRHNLHLLYPFLDVLEVDEGEAVVREAGRLEEKLSRQLQNVLSHTRSLMRAISTTMHLMNIENDETDNATPAPVHLSETPSEYDRSLRDHIIIRDFVDFLRRVQRDFMKLRYNNGCRRTTRSPTHTGRRS